MSGKLVFAKDSRGVGHLDEDVLSELNKKRLYTLHVYFSNESMRSVGPVSSHEVASRALDSLPGQSGAGGEVYVQVYRRRK